MPKTLKEQYFEQGEPGKRQLVKQLADQGLTTQQIAKELNIVRERVRMLLRDAS